MPSGTECLGDWEGSGVEGGESCIKGKEGIGEDDVILALVGRGDTRHKRRCIKKSKK
jgi:hypothetical protein